MQQHCQIRGAQSVAINMSCLSATSCHSASQSGVHLSTTLTSAQRLTGLAGFLPAGSSKEGGSDVERFKVSGPASSIKALMRRQPLVRGERAEFHLLPSGVKVRRHCALLAAHADWPDGHTASRKAAIFMQLNEPRKFIFRISGFVYAACSAANA